MDRRIRVLALFLVACFGVLFVQLNNLQVRRASALTDNAHNQAEEAPPSAYSQPRGEIVSADNVVLAMSHPTKDSIGQQRVYAQGSLFSEITGYYGASPEWPTTGVEEAYNQLLEQHTSSANNLKEMLTEQSATDNVVLTVSTRLQNVARAALAGRPGAIVAIDPRNGDILAMYGNPNFDPNLMASHNDKLVKQTYKKDLTGVSQYQDAPLVNQATDHLYPPGSTMKVITTAAIFDHDPAIANIIWPSIGATPLPDSTLLLHNFGGEVCGGSLLEVLTVSCDTAFALIGVKLGGTNVVDEAEAFGFNKTPPIDIDNVYGQPDATAAVIPSPKAIDNPDGTPTAFVGYTGIGQLDDEQSALGNTLVAAGLADNGTIMTPHVMSEVINGQTGALVEKYQPHPWLQATSAATASLVRTDMLSVASSGTAQGLFPPGDDVAAKTGTAETSGQCTANWLIATGPAGAGETPRVAVAAVIPASGADCSSENTGARVAGPAVAQLYEAALAATP